MNPMVTRKVIDTLLVIQAKVKLKKYLYWLALFIGFKYLFYKFIMKLMILELYVDIYSANMYVDLHDFNSWLQR